MRDRKPGYDKNVLTVPSKTKKVETSEDMRELLAGNLVADQARTINEFSSFTCSGNSYSVEACEYLATVIKNSASEDLESVDFGNMFVSRLIEDIPKSLKMLLTAIMDKPVKSLSI